MDERGPEQNTHPFVNGWNCPISLQAPRNGKERLRKGRCRSTPEDGGPLAEPSCLSLKLDEVWSRLRLRSQSAETLACRLTTSQPWRTGEPCLSHHRVEGSCAPCAFVLLRVPRHLSLVRLLSQDRLPRVSTQESRLCRLGTFDKNLQLSTIHSVKNCKVKVSDCHVCPHTGTIFPADPCGSTVGMATSG